MFPEKYITSITIQDIEYQIFKQNMWLIMSCNSKEIDRIELLNQSVEEAIDHMVNRRPTNYFQLLKETKANTKKDSLKIAFKNLCAYDVRNPNNVLDTMYGINPRCTKEPCMCDNCDNGRTQLALEIIRLNQEIVALKNRK